MYAISNMSPRSVSKEQGSGILEESNVLKTLDTQSVCVWSLRHPDLGDVILVNSAFGESDVLIAA